MYWNKKEEEIDSLKRKNELLRKRNEQLKEENDILRNKLFIVKGTTTMYQIKAMKFFKAAKELLKENKALEERVVVTEEMQNSIKQNKILKEINENLSARVRELEQKLDLMKNNRIGPTQAEKEAIKVYLQLLKNYEII